MIESLRLRNIGVIADAAIHFPPGLTAITGETGAGKTMLLTGLNLVRGRKVDAAIVRSGSDAAEADSEWVISGERARSIQAQVESAGGSVEFDEGGCVVLIGRTVPGVGRSRSLLGGRTVPTAVLEEVAQDLIAVHGQSDQSLLRSASRQRDLLDAYGGDALLAARTDYAAAHVAWRDATELLGERRQGATAWQAELASLTEDLKKIDDVAPQSDEDEDVERRLRVLTHSGALLESVNAALVAIDGDDDARVGSLVDIHDALRNLERAAEADSSLGEFVARLRSLAAELNDVEQGLSAYLAGIDADPAMQAWLEERRAALTSIKRLHGPQLADVLSWAEAARAKVDGAQSLDDAALVDLVARCQEDLSEHAASLTALRTAAGIAFSEAVSAELGALALGSAQVEVRLTSSSDPQEWSPSGADQIEFLLSANPGQPPLPLAKSASGGELSRVMLAIEVVMAGADPVPTFVFDEIDAGVGGKAAVEIGRRLAHLARHSQVIVVTHLAQVAAFADHQVVVRKQADGLVTSSDVIPVTGEDRVTELVRMLAGLEDSASGAAHARELLAMAEAARASEGSSAADR